MTKEKIIWRSQVSELSERLSVLYYFICKIYKHDCVYHWSVGTEKFTMKIIVAFALFTVVSCAPGTLVLQEDEEDIGANMKYILVPTSDGKYRYEDLTTPEIDDFKAKETDVTYHFFSTHDLVRGTKIKSSDVALLRNTEFRGSKETLFIIHGWVSNNESHMNYEISQAILSKHDVNLFIVDWSPIAEKNYITAKAAVEPIGKFLADFINALVKTYQVSVAKVSLVGHSLGAHIAGNAGAALKGQVDHIVGLDPALPLFNNYNTKNRLDPTDAKYVQVIHTNAGLLGFKISIGHADYFPNGGASQAGCGLDITGVCAHNRAYFYYVESVQADRSRFVASSCKSYSEYTKGRCTSNAKSALGGYSVDNRAHGDFYLNTNTAAPFAQG